MKELKELSANYATEKTNEMMSQIVAQAFSDGYRMGYKDREDEIPVDLRDGKTEFVDLGLPSGTLWSADYEIKGGETNYFPFIEADKYSIPSKVQWEELVKLCKWETKYLNGIYEFYCIGPNGNAISFINKGVFTRDGNDIFSNNAIFWLKCDEEKQEKDAAYIYYSNQVTAIVYPLFMGYKLPMRLVKTK